jgi:hypothetical protein
MVSPGSGGARQSKKRLHVAARPGGQQQDFHWQVLRPTAYKRMQSSRKQCML